MIEMHWIITVQHRLASDIAVSTVSGTANLPAGSSRAAAFEAIRQEASRTLGVAAIETPVILFFSLEPDRLGQVTT